MTKRSSLLVLALGVVLLIAIAVVGIPAYLASGSFRDRVTTGLSQKLNRPVELESLRLSLLPRPRVVLERVELGPPIAGPRSWIEVETADLSVRLRPLLRRQVEVDGEGDVAAFGVLGLRFRRLETVFAAQLAAGPVEEQPPLVGQAEARQPASGRCRRNGRREWRLELRFRRRDRGLPTLARRRARDRF